MKIKFLVETKTNKINRGKIITGAKVKRYQNCRKTKQIKDVKEWRQKLK